MELGRPTDYTSDLGNKICAELALGQSLRTVCKSTKMPCVATIFNWFKKHPDFLEQYARAKEESTDALAEEVLDISDDSLDGAKSVDPKSAGAVVQAYRLKIDTRKWLMSKMKPKKYGEKLDLTTDGKPLPTPIYGGKSTDKDV